jgi:hypothetical protein
MLAPAHAPTAKLAGAETTQRPEEREQHAKYEAEYQQEFHWERHHYAEQAVIHSPISPLRYGGPLACQWLTARVTFAAAITKKLLIPIADFIPEADWASILMVNGELMAKPMGTRL